MLISYRNTLANEILSSLYTTLDSLLQDHERCAPNEVCTQVCACVCIRERECVCCVCVFLSVYACMHMCVNPPPPSQTHTQGFPRPPKIVAGGASRAPRPPEPPPVNAGAGGQAAGGKVKGGGGEEGGGPVLVSFSVVCGTTMMHESLGMIGACPELGSWVNPVPMSADLWPVWKLEVCE